MMNYNPHDLKVGDTVILDGKLPGVTIVDFTPNKLFAKIKFYGFCLGSYD